MRVLVLLTCLIVLVLCGCQTPERRAVRQRMERLAAENSELKAKTETSLAQSQIDSARQRQEDLKLLDSVNAQLAQMNRQMDEMRKQMQNLPAQRVNEAQPKEPTPPVASPAEEKKDGQTLLDVLQEQRRKEAEAKIAAMQEQLAKAQAQAEAAKLAVLAAENAKDVKADPVLKQKAFPITQFVDSSGKLVDLAKYKGKPLVLSVMKGFYSQGVCVYCTRQTADLADNIKSFKDLGCEVLVVYPGREEHINTFVRSVREHEKSDDPRFQLPFKVLLDVNLDAVRALNIIGDLAHPTTFVISSDGVVSYQYIGRSMSDRPSVKDVLDQVRKAGAAKP